MSNPTRGLQREITLRLGARLVQEGNRLHYLADRASITGKFSDIECRNPTNSQPAHYHRLQPLPAYAAVPHISRKRITPGCTRCHTRPVTSVNQNGFISQVADICYVPMRGHIRFCGLNAWGCQKRSVVWLSHSSNVMASVSFIWMPALNVCRTSPLSIGNQEQHEIINHGNRTGYSDCVATGQYRLRIGNYL